MFLLHHGFTYNFLIDLWYIRMQPSVIIITIASEIEDSATPSRTEQLTLLGLLMEMSAYVGGTVPYGYIRCRYCTPSMHAESRPHPPSRQPVPGLQNLQT